MRFVNFLAHLFLSGDAEGLRLGAMLGDFVRGHPEHPEVPVVARKGILLHRYIDQYMDSLPALAQLRARFDPTFRRYSGIIIDMAFDHELAVRWDKYSTVTLEQFDLDLRSLLGRYDAVLPEKLKMFMRYADRHGLLAAYRDEAEILVSLRGVGKRLTRPNPLHRVEEIWGQIKPVLSESFTLVFPRVQEGVAAWLQEPRAAASAG